MSNDDPSAAVRGSEFRAGLGPLPDARWKWAGNGPRPYEDAYSAEQMRKYAENAVAAERERCAKPMEEAAARLLAPKRTNEVDRHVAEILQRHAARIRGA